MRPARFTGLLAALVALTWPSHAGLRVLVSIPPLYSWAASVAGTNAVVEALLPPERGPHGYQLRIKDLARLRQADLLVLNGLGVDDWILTALRKAAGNQASPKVVTVSDGLGALVIGGQDGGDPNPHIWLDPSIAKWGVSNILSGLSKIDRDHGDAYASNAEAYCRRLDRLDQDISQGLAGLPHRSMVTFHDAFPYFARRYGLRIAGVLEEQPNIEPTPRQLAAILGSIRSNRVSVLFVEPQYRPRLALQIASDLNLKVAELDVLETGSASPDFYEEGMRRNLAVLIENLK